MNNMKKIPLIYCSILAGILLISCDENREDNLVIKQLDGRWEITQIVYSTPSKPDSIVTSQTEDLGALVFDKCESKNSNETPCKGKRITNSGEELGFDYSARGEEPTKSVTLAFYTNDSKNNWHGVYDIIELGDRLILKSDVYNIEAKR